MKKNIRLFLLLVLALTVMVWPTAAAEVTASGTCDENLTWTLTDDGTLTISGQGPMMDFWSTEVRPWHSQRYRVTRLVVEPGVTTVGDLAFCDMTELEEVTLPDTLTSIGLRAFVGCRDLLAIDIPKSVTTIWTEAFGYCTSLREVVIRGGVKSLESLTFESCSALQSVTLMEGVEEIGYHVFDGATLPEIYIPSTVSKIWVEAFANCSGMERIILSEENPYYTLDPSGVLYSRDMSVLIRAPESLEGVYTVPDTVNEIALHGFYRCSELTEVILPDQITQIPLCCFAQCVRLKTVHLPQATETMGNRAFADCFSLTDITIPARVESVGTAMFENCISLSAIQVDGENQNFCSGPGGCLLSKSGTVLYAAPSVPAFTIPDGVKLVKFRALSCIISLTVPESLDTYEMTRSFFCHGLQEIIYCGSEEQFAKIQNGRGGLLADTLSDITVHYSEAPQACAFATAIPAHGQTHEDTALFRCGCGMERNVGLPVDGEYIRQYVSEAAGRIYFQEGQHLRFLDMNTGILKNALVFPGDSNSSPYYFQRDQLLYWCEDGVFIVFDLDQGKVVDVRWMKDAPAIRGFGVDGEGRLYLCTREEEQYHLDLYSTDGRLLDRMDLEGPVYEFTAFSPTGDFYFDAYRNYRAWGYDHPMHAIFGASVSGDSFADLGDGYERALFQDICQLRYYEHQGNAALFDDRYLVSSLGYVFDVSGGLTDSASLCFRVDHAYDEELEDTDYDTSSVGVRMVYVPERNTIVAYGSDRMILEYNPADGTVLNIYRTQHYVFDLLPYGDAFVAIEQEGGRFYIELFGRDDMVSAQTVVIDLNEQEYYRDHTAENVKNRWEEAFITSHVPVYAAEHSLDPYAPAVYTDEMKQALMDYSNYLRWLGGLTPFESADEAVWDNAAKGALILTANGELSHSPDRPEGMSDAFFEAGYQGCSDSNLSGGGVTNGRQAMETMEAILDDSANISVFECGHRFAFLQRAGWQIAYGSTASRLAQTIVDYNRQVNESGNIEGVDNNGCAYTWPSAGAVPDDIIGTDALWSINFNSDMILPATGGITVTITDLDTGTVYDRTASVGNSNYLGVGTHFGMWYYFDPPEAESYAGKSYQVNLGNLQLASSQPAEIVYTVSFFELEHDYEYGVCIHCGEGTHRHELELRDALAAGCETAGYTGDSWCIGCGILVEAGTVIPAVGHSYENHVCTLCGRVAGRPGDVNDDGAVNSDDAVHLLYHTLFGETLYPVSQECDFNGSGTVDADDAIHLLYHALFGDVLYPLR